MRQAITRMKQGKSFTYFDSAGNNIADPEVIDRISSLAIPPAWQDVQIAQAKTAKIQAKGKDSAGRLQYIYSPKHTEKRAQQKFDRITSFAENLPKLRRQVEKDLQRKRFDKRKVLACAVSLMDETYFRVGNHNYAQENGSYGLTTLRSKHITVDGTKVIFDFVGKSGQAQHKEVENAQISKLIQQLDEMPGYELFRYYDNSGSLVKLTSADVNEYIKTIMGDDYSAKDFRTWGGTLLACMELAKMSRPQTVTERKKSVTTCVKKVAKKLGNTPAIARASYIDPRVLTMFDNSDKLQDMYETIKTIKQSKYLNSDEHCAIKLLSS